MSEAIAEFSDYRGLVRALNTARELRNVSFETMDELVEAPKGYFSKILAPSGSRRVTMKSISLAFWALGIKCQVHDDPDGLKFLAGKLDPRMSGAVRSGTINFAVSRKFLKKIASKGGIARSEKLSTKRRQAIARKAGKASALIRWGDVKEAANRGANRRRSKAPRSRSVPARRKVAGIAVPLARALRPSVSTLA